MSLHCPRNCVFFSSDCRQQMYGKWVLSAVQSQSTTARVCVFKKKSLCLDRANHTQEATAMLRWAGNLRLLHILFQWWLKHHRRKIDILLFIKWVNGKRCFTDVIKIFAMDQQLSLTDLIYTHFFGAKKQTPYPVLHFQTLFPHIAHDARCRLTLSSNIRCSAQNTQPKETRQQRRRVSSKKNEKKHRSSGKDIEGRKPNLGYYRTACDGDEVFSLRVGWQVGSVIIGKQFQNLMDAGPHQYNIHTQQGYVSSK